MSCTSTAAQRCATLGCLFAMLLAVATHSQDFDQELLEAAKRNDAAAVRELLSKGAHANARGEFGYTSLHWAAGMGTVDVISALVGAGADVNAKSDFGWTPLMLAARDDKVGAVLALLEAGAEALPDDKLIGGWLCGQVVDDASARVPFAAVLLLVEAAADTPGAETEARTLTDAQGRFCLTHVRPGVYWMRVEKPEGPPQPTRRVEASAGLLQRLEPIALEPAVGDYGDLARLAFVGNRTFTAAAIRDALLQDADFLVASHPLAPRGAYLETLRKKVLTGYQNGGFPGAQVSARLDQHAATIVVQVSEGQRYMRGGIRVAGAKAIPPATLVQRLGNSYPPSESIAELFPSMDPKNPGAFTAVDRSGRESPYEVPVWEKGKPAPFAKGSLDDLSGQIADVLTDFGYFFPKLEVKVVPYASKGTAELVVEIREAGAEGIVKEIEITGNEKNTPDQVLQYLGLKPGMRIDRELLRKTEMMLLRAGRFSTYKVSPELAETHPPQVKLKIDLTEFKGAPPLFTEFSPDEKALLRMCTSLGDPALRREDFRLLIHPTEKSPESFEILLSERGGMGLFSVGETEERGIRHAAVFSSKVSALVSPALGRKLVAPAGEAQRWLSMSYELGPNQTKSSIKIQWGVSKKRFAPTHGETAGFRFSARALPVACEAKLQEKGTKVSSERGILTVLSETDSMRIDAASGRLLEWNVLDPKDKFEFRFDRQAGAFEQAWQTLEQLTVSHPNLRNPERPVSTLLTYALEAALDDPFVAALLLKKLPLEARPRVAAAAHSLLSEPIFAPLDDIVAQLKTPGEFEIPVEGQESAEVAQKMAGSSLPAFIFKYTHEFFPPRSWPWTVLHEAVFVMGQQDKYTGLELERLYNSEETGPLGFLTIAELLKYIGSPRAKDFAEKGLGRLSAADFRSDVRLLADGNTPLARSMQNLAAGLRKLPHEEVEAVAATLPPVAAAMLRQTVLLLRQGQDKPLSEALAPVLDLLWNLQLRNRVQARLGRVLNQ
jgi:ankyrin repeat protein/surface antigen-like variable number repeat protein